jgi:hypothetical protein
LLETDYGLFVQQREEAADWTGGYCPAADNDFNSLGCQYVATETPEMSETNGGVCQTSSTTPNLPVSSQCAPLKISGTITVVNGPEDLFIQWTYGRALVAGYQQALGADKAAISTYPGPDGAGHGVLIQHPLWTQEHIYAALRGN